MPKDASKSSKMISTRLRNEFFVHNRVFNASAVSTSAVLDKNRENHKLIKSRTNKADKLKSDSKLQNKAVVKAVLDTLERDTMDESWHGALEHEFQKPYFIKLKEFLLAEHLAHTVYPSSELSLRFTPLDQVKVVILGQDPYHDAGQAHGLSFSVLPPTKPPGSLKNIYKQLALDFNDFNPPSSGDLSLIAKAGVLWLNASLTVRAHKAASHSKKGWEIFTAEVIRTILRRSNSHNKGVVFMAWGLHALNTCLKLEIDQTKHLLLQSAHPSPLSAHKGFLGNGHFRLANEWLKKQYGDEACIDWTLLNKN